MAMTNTTRYLLAAILLLLALGTLLIPRGKEEVTLQTTNVVSSVPSKERLSTEWTARTTVPRASRSASTAPQRPRVAPRARTAPTPAYTGEVDGIPALLRRIGGCESSGRPDGPLVWNAQNRTSSASGAFQILTSTWRGWATAYGSDVGAPNYPRAKDAPASVQTTVAVRAFNRQGSGPWAASRSCWA